ncbi:MAG: hypothetical protein HC888_12055, partial [Candidatus Competibacteraceae bacterium]|nr:hypothetical protein [Candidatus Competibacteraceae bacterium]
MLFLDLKGSILKHYQVGHAQNPAVLKLRNDLPGLQTVTINFWGNQGILHFFDAEGNLYHRCEPNNFGSMCLPVNWRGDGLEFFLHSTNHVLGGMFRRLGAPRRRPSRTTGHPRPLQRRPGFHGRLPRRDRHMERAGDLDLHPGRRTEVRSSLPAAAEPAGEHLQLPGLDIPCRDGASRAGGNRGFTVRRGPPL